MRLEARGHVLGSQNSVRKQGGWGGAESGMEAGAGFAEADFSACLYLMFRKL